MNQHGLKKTFSVVLSLTVLLSGLAMAAPGDVNSVNNGRNIVGGTYYNTAGNKTVFQNSGPSGLWLHSGQTVRGLEVNSGGNTGNGGWVQLSAPGSVIRLDGDIDVSALKSGSFYTGNGGKVTVDTAYLYQNGNIYANGNNGGTVNMNVGSATFGPLARIEAMGSKTSTGSVGAGGSISVNATGAVDIQSGAIFDASGNLVTGSDTIVSIVAGVVNNAGIIRANGLQGDLDGAHGGHVVITAPGGADTSDAVNAINNADSDMFSAGEQSTLTSSLTNLQNNYNGSIINNGIIQANGGNGVDGVNGSNGGKGGDAGYLTLGANQSIINNETIQANGGAGGAGGAQTSTDTNDGPQLVVLDGFDTSYSSTTQTYNIVPVNGTSQTQLVLPANNNGAVQVGQMFVTSTMVDTGSTRQLVLRFYNASHNLVDIRSYSRSINDTNDWHISWSTGPQGTGRTQFNRTFDLTISGFQQGTSAGAIATVVESVMTRWADFRHESATVATGGAGGNGGNAGEVGLSAWYITNNGSITANGGNGGVGGNATANDNDYETGQLVNAAAWAIATGGNGGNGGNGGLVSLSTFEPVGGNGLLQANGGSGGNGGNATANANAYSVQSSWTEIEQATKGNGGNGGNGGSILTGDSYGSQTTQVNGGSGGTGNVNGSSGAAGELFNAGL